MKQVSTFAAAIVLGLSAASPGHAGDAQHDHGAPQVAQAPAALSEGEVRKVDKEAGKLTIKHGPLANLGMPAMTMVFRVSDPKMLDQVKAGDRIRFEAGNVNGALIVVSLQRA